MSSNQGYPGQQSPTDDNSLFTQIAFAVKQAFNLRSIATLVQVKSVTTTGLVAPTGTVSLQPLVNMVDGEGNTQAHGVLNNIPYFRLVGAGGAAVIMDPKVGDIGLAVFADRDISSVKKNKAASTPASRRRNDMADGLYIGGFLSQAPTTYIRFTNDGKIICAVGASNPFEFVVASDHVQMKKHGSSNLHVTVAAGGITAGQAITIAADPYPGD